MSALPKPQLMLTKTRSTGFDAGLPGARHIRSSRNDRPYHYMVHSPHFAYEEYAIHLSGSTTGSPSTQTPPRRR